MLNNFKWDFFIAHAGADKTEAEMLYAYLCKHARVFLDTKKLKLGDDWDLELASAQKNSLITLVLVSAKIERAYYQREEIAAAISLARDEFQYHRVVPIYLDETGKNNIPYGLRLKQGLSIFNEMSIEDVAKRLIEEFGDLLEIENNETVVSGESVRRIDDSSNINLNISMNISSYNQICYDIKKTDGCIEIIRTHDYLTLCENGGPIQAISYSHQPFSWSLPGFDFKIVNNSNKTIFLSDVNFDISESRLDPAPIIYIPYDSYGNNARHILLRNDGWGEVRNLNIKLLSMPVKKSKTQDIKKSSFTHDFNVGDFTDSINIDISNVLYECGINLDKIDSIMKKPSYNHSYEKKDLSRYLGGYTEGYSVIFGLLEFEGLQFDGQTRVYNIFFETEVFIYNIFMPALPTPPSYYYKAKFEVERDNYQCQVPISHVLKPGDADRFVINIGMSKSSYHKFNIAVNYNDDYTIKCRNNFVLLSCIPKSGVQFMTDKKHDLLIF